MSIIERVSSGQGFIIHYVGYYLGFSKCPLYRDEGCPLRGFHCSASS